MDAHHLLGCLATSFGERAGRIATRIRRDESWVTQTYLQLDARRRRFAAHLVDLGVQAGDRVAIFSANCPEWTEVDLGCLSVRAVSVPIYSTSTPDQCRHILRDSGCVVAIVAGASELARIAEVWDDLPDLRAIVTFDAVPEVPAGREVLSYPELQSRTPASDLVDEVSARLDAASGDDLATIVYTSGTTGEPRGVMLTNRAFAFELEALSAFFPVTSEDSSLCFLPLSHALERAWTFKVLSEGCMNTYVSDARKVAEMLVLARPTLMVSVPRLYEKVYVTAHQKVAGSPAKQRVLEWALRVGGHNQRAYRKGKTPSAYWRAQLGLADKLVFQSIRDAMGGPKKVMACGGAPVRKEIEEFFSAIGMHLHVGYGLTEAAPLVSFNSDSAFKIGTAGRVVVGGEVRIGADGEILYRGPNVMQGYWNLPDATAAALDDEGWLHTGDVGYVDTDGYLVITDRIKDLIVTSNGKNIAPAPIEGTILSDPLFEQAVVLGDNRPFLTLLVTPSRPHLEDLANAMQIKVGEYSELLSDPRIVEEFQRRVRVMTEKLPSHEQIKDLRVLLEEFTMDNGLLTPTLKVKRREVEQRFAQVIEDMYAKVAEFRSRKEE